MMLDLKSDDFPSLLGFFVLLPEGVPIRDGATWTIEGEVEPLLQGVRLTQTLNTPPLPNDGDGPRNFVSMRFWHVEDTTDPKYVTEDDALDRAWERLVPLTAGMSMSAPPKLERYRTAVELVTCVPALPDLSADGQTNPLNRCLETLFEFLRALRLLKPSEYEEVTVQQLGRKIIVFSPGDSGDTKMHSLGTIDNLPNFFYSLGSSVGDFGRVDFERVMVQQLRLRLGDPYAVTGEHVADAHHALEVKGNLGQSITKFATASEVLLSGLLGMLLWEDKADDAEAAAILSKNVTSRIKQEYQPRLRGSWSVRSGAIRDWNYNIASVRHRIVHGGYRPTRKEAVAAQAAWVRLHNYIMSRLEDRADHYLITSWVIANATIQEHGGGTRKVREWQRSQPNNQILTYIKEYGEWRKRVDALIERTR